jgi:predicted MFS family arabinose efflux permease
MLAGLGFALVYPSVASQALNRVPPRNRGAAMALFSAAVNLVLGIGGPFMGILAEHRGTGAVFYLAAVAAFLAGLIVLSGRTSAPYRG